MGATRAPDTHHSIACHRSRQSAPPNVGNARQALKPASSRSAQKSGRRVIEKAARGRRVLAGRAGGVMLLAGPGAELKRKKTDYMGASALVETP